MAKSLDDPVLGARTAGAPAIEVTITPGRILTVMLAGVAVCCLAGIAVYIAMAFGHQKAFGLRKLFDLDEERTIPTFFSAVQLLLAAALLAVQATSRDGAVRRWRAHWLVLAAGFVYLAFDEATAIHEWFSAIVVRLTGTRSPTTAWVVPATIGACVLAMAYVPFLRSLPRREAFLFVGSGAAFVGGAVGLDMLEGVLLDGGYSLAGATYRTTVVAEEMLEMLSIAVFIWALLSRLAALGCRLELRSDAARL